MSNQKFTNRACDELSYYVYCLVDPTDNKVFYVGKGKNNRVFNHIENVEDQTENDTDQLIDEGEKNKRIKEIGAQNVKHFILRHGLTEDQALQLESTLIDFLMDERVNGGTKHLTNLVHGHHHYDKGIKTPEEINAQYPEKDFRPKEEDKIIIVLLNSLKDNDNIYDRARGDWAFKEEKVKECTHVLAVYHGVVRAVYPVSPDVWEMTRAKGDHKSARWRFTSTEDKNSPYLYARIYNEEEIIDNGDPTKTRRKKVDFNGKTINPQRGAWCANY